MAVDLFQDLPPPSAPQLQELQSSTVKELPSNLSPPAQAPPPALKSALKRPKPPSSQEEPKPGVSASGKRLRFKTTTDASETQVIEAMQKIASHIKYSSKYSKVSKLAIQLIHAGSVKPATSDHFFAILEGAMSFPTTCNDASLRADYHALFSEVQDVVECLNKKQKNLLSIWTIRAVMANDLFTDDSFVILA